jgi:streptogramin lyase
VFDVPCARDVAVGQRAVWVVQDCVSGDGSGLTRIDPESGETDELRFSTDSYYNIQIALGSVWLHAGREGTLGTVLRVDERSMGQPSRIELRQASDELAFAGGYVWAVGEARGTLLRLDPRTNAVSSVIVDDADDIVGVSASKGGLWTVEDDGKRVSRWVLRERTP